MKAVAFWVLFLLSNGHVCLNAQADQQDANAHKIPDQWYQKSLEASLQIWGDLDMLCKGQDDMLPDHSQLVIDSAVGRLVYLDWCLQRFGAALSGHVDSDEITYLVRLVYALDEVYRCALKYDTTGRIESAQPVLRSIKKHMDSILDAPSSFNTDDSFVAPREDQACGANLFNPVKGLWYCGCRII